MNQTLYRKYRPQIFKDVIGQNHIKIILQNEILSGQIAHAYLFTGPRGTGKTSLARILAKSLNCLNKKANEFEPCNKCSSCQEITKGKALDLIEIDAATHTQVDKVRENIVENIKFAPHNKYKIFIIDEVHMLSTAAFNALLKTLEEPPEYAIFILCTTESYKLPETIISRCQRFDFKKIPAQEITQRLKKISDLEKIKISDEVLKTIALRSGGFARDAESLLGQITALLSDTKSTSAKPACRQGRATADRKEITLENISAVLPRSDIYSISKLVESLINKNASEGVEIINKLVSDGVDLERFNLDLIDYLRKIILIKVNLKNKDENISALPEETKTKLIQQSEKIEFSVLIKILENFISKQTQIKTAEISQLPLEIAVVEICSFSAFASKKSYWTTAPVRRSPALPAGRFSEGGDKLQDKNKIKSENSEDKKQNTEIKSEEKIKENTKTEVLKSEKIKTEIKKIGLEEIKKSWPKILKQSQEFNHSLPLILKSAYPFEIQNNILKLGFEFEIHAEKLKENKSLIILEDLLKKNLDEKIIVKTKILNKEKIQTLKQELKPILVEINDDQLNSIADSFGGKVVE